MCNCLLCNWEADSCLFESLPFYCPSAVSKISGPGPANKRFRSYCSVFVCSNMCVAVTAQWYKCLCRPGVPASHRSQEKAHFRDPIFRKIKKTCMTLVQPGLKKSQIISLLNLCIRWAFFFLFPNTSYSIGSLVKQACIFKLHNKLCSLLSQKNVLALVGFLLRPLIDSQSWLCTVSS